MSLFKRADFARTLKNRLAERKIEMMKEMTKEEREIKEKKVDLIVRIGLAVIAVIGAGVLLYNAWRVY